MIDPTKRHLTAVFTFVIVVFNVIILVLSYLFLHQSIMNGIRSHMRDDIKKEFLNQFHSAGLEPFGNLWDEHHMQILNRTGAVVVSSMNSVKFYPDLNKKLLDEAFSGSQGFETRPVLGKSHLISYFPLDGHYAGRVATSIEEEIEYEKIFLKLIVLAFPGMILLSYFVSRYLVNHAMKPISDIFTFQETFSSNVTHELRSPLASMKGNFEVILRKTRPADEYREVLASSLQDVNRIINLLHNLSLLASSKFKPLDLFKHQTDIGHVVRELAVACEADIRVKQITLTLSVLPGASCLCDEDLIRRTLENLFDNAVKYTPESGSIDIKLAVEKKKLHLTMANTTDAMDKEEIGHVFEPFFRGSKSILLNSEGKGLGLYISRYIVRSHGGDITMDATAGHLFSLTVSLPLA